MNIFVLDDCPKKSAEMACDKHVVKMILESAQMLCTVANDKGFESPYKPVHRKHPCTIWVSKSRSNWEWLIDHSVALCDEYTSRYRKTHKSRAVIEWAKSLNIDLPSTGLTNFAQAMPEKYKRRSAVEAYRLYYLGEKKRFAKWKFTKKPDWWL